jgi:hypothetical protein
VRLRRAALALLAVLIALPVLAGCSGGGSGGSGESAPALLATAKKTLDDTQSLHFVLSSSGAPSTGTVLTGGNGDIARPSSFAGTLKVQVSGASVNLKVVSVNGKVYAQLPFAANYSLIDPKTFGFGISQLLTKAQNPKLGAKKRVNGEVVQEVTADLPGQLVADLLTSKDPSKPVHASFLIATDSGQLRRAALTGPFFTADADGTYTLDLSQFGEHVSITAPPTG